MKTNVKNIVNKAKGLPFRALAVASLAVASVGSALAQTTTGGGTGAEFDYTDAVAAVQVDANSFFTTNGIALLGVLVIALGFGLVWRLIKRGVKSV